MTETNPWIATIAGDYVLVELNRSQLPAAPSPPPTKIHDTVRSGTLELRIDGTLTVFQTGVHCFFNGEFNRFDCPDREWSYEGTWSFSDTGEVHLDLTLFKYEIGGYDARATASYRTNALTLCTSIGGHPCVNRWVYTRK